MQRNDLCRILGVPITATKAECKIAFHKLAHIHHPDKGGNADTFKKINAAYQEIVKLPEYSAPIIRQGVHFEGFTTGGFTIHVWQSHEGMGFQDMYAKQRNADMAADLARQQQDANRQADMQQANTSATDAYQDHVKDFKRKHGNRSTFTGTIHF